MMKNLFNLSKSDLKEHFIAKYGQLDKMGWSPRRRYKFDYYPPGDIYEAIISKLVTSETNWIDIGGGRALFPQNKQLSKKLSSKCNLLVGIDPSQNIFENPYVHEKEMCMIEDYNTDKKFDLITFRMVAEHIDDPETVLKKLQELISPQGKVVIYTINKYSPVSIITYLTPFSIHFKIKKIFFGGEEKDTFPVAYKMNNKKELNQLFDKYDFSEICFRYLDDLSIFHRFKLLNLIELYVWKVFKIFKLRYPENNIFAVYSKNL